MPVGRITAALSNEIERAAVPAAEPLGIEAMRLLPGARVAIGAVQIE